MSIFSKGLNFITDTLTDSVSGLGIVGNIGLGLLGSAFGGGDDESSGQGFATSRAGQKTQEAVFKGQALSHAERLRRLGGVYEEMKYRGAGATRQQPSIALQRFLKRYHDLRESNPYYARYRQMTTPGQKIATVTDSLTARSSEIIGEAATRVKS